MKLVQKFIFICSAGLAAVVSLNVPPGFGEVEKLTTKEIAACLRSPDCHRMFVVGHRAGGVGAPENSVAAVINSVKTGVPVVEIDVRASKDGEVFLLHNHTLNKMTNGRGKIELQSAKKLRKLRLPNGERLPYFRDVYEQSRGKAMLLIHFKDNVVEAVAKWIEEHGSFDDAIFFVSTPEEITAAASFKARHPEMLVLVKLLSLPELQQFQAKYPFRPDILEVVPFNQNTVRQFQALGYKVYCKSGSIERVAKRDRAEAIKKLKAKGIDLVLAEQPLLILD